MIVMERGLRGFEIKGLDDLFGRDYLPDYEISEIFPKIDSGISNKMVLTCNPTTDNYFYKNINKMDTKNKTAFELAKTAYGTGAYDDATMEFLFPELKESEDEKLRKRCIEELKTDLYAAEEQYEHCNGSIGDGRIKAIKWGISKLENCSEQVKMDPVSKDTWIYIEEWKEKVGHLPGYADELAACIDYVIRRKNHESWTEDDSIRLKDVISIIENSGNAKSIKDHYINFLRLVPEKISWKPSGEQLNLLDKVYQYLWRKNAPADMQDGLVDFIEELKKL